MGNPDNIAGMGVPAGAIVFDMGTLKCFDGMMWRDLF